MCFAQGQGGAAGGPSSASFGAGDASAYPAVGAANPAGTATTASTGSNVPLPTARPTVADIGKQLDKAEIQMQPAASDTRARSLDAAERGMQSTPSERTMDAGTSTQSLAYRKKRAQDLLEG